MKRRNFLSLITAATALTLTHNQTLFAQIRKSKKIKPITGTWFEFQHHSEIEGKYWNDTLQGFTANDWDIKIKEIASSGIKYLVLLDVAIYGKSFYPSKLLPQHSLGCTDPLEAALTAADKYGLRFFISNGFFGDWRNPLLLMKDQKIHELRVKAMEELTEKYSHHKSFYGWYYPNETGISGHYDNEFINYVNTCTKEAKRLTPNGKNLIAPYGTKNIKFDDKYLPQLDLLDIDFIAYQDEVGVQKTTPDQTAAFYQNLNKFHKKSGKSKLWADVEIFEFESKVYNSPLLPAAAERVIPQLKAVSEYVDQIFIYQYTGMLNKPGTKLFTGFDNGKSLYQSLVKEGWLKG